MRTSLHQDIFSENDDVQHYLELFEKKEFITLISSLTSRLVKEKSNFKLRYLMGLSLAKVERFDNALVEFDKVLAVNKKFFLAFYNKGIIFEKFGKLDFALKNYNKALDLRPDIAELHLRVANVLDDQGHLNEAIKSYLNSVKINPKLTDAYSNLGMVYQKKGNLDKAISCYSDALTLDPDMLETRFNLGLALFKMNKLDDAEICFKKVITSEQNMYLAIYFLGNLYKKKGLYKDSIQQYKRALEIKPDHIGVISNMASAFREIDNIEEAISCLYKILAIDKNNIHAYHSLGLIYGEIGDPNKSYSMFSKVLRIDPNHVEAHYNISLSKKFLKSDDQFKKMLDLYKLQNIDKDKRSILCFALAKAFEDQNDIESAFKYLKEGNELRKSDLNYNISDDIKLFANLKVSAKEIKKVCLKPSQINLNSTPIFIVGMPRSGTSLVEQIISSHSLVEGLGELIFIEKFSKDIFSGNNEITFDDVLHFRENYFNQIFQHRQHCDYFTDKLPQNFKFIPLIVAAFPEGKIIHVKRQASANCWSNFQHRFSSKALGYSHDLKDIVKYYKLYEDLMKNWFFLFPNKIYDLNYDDLVENQEDKIKDLLEYIDIPWEDSCLSPHENRRTVKTASSNQVREKIYSNSALKWLKYQKFLDGIFDDL